MAPHLSQPPGRQVQVHSSGSTAGCLASSLKCPGGGYGQLTCAAICLGWCAADCIPDLFTDPNCQAAAEKAHKDCSELLKPLFPWTSDDRVTLGAIDPNEKVTISRKFIRSDQVLSYATHFENVGTAEARDVFVSDALDPNLDLSTVTFLTPTDASIDVNIRTAKWSLLSRNLLPHETDNVLFSVKPKPGLPSGTVIRNTSTIQFEPESCTRSAFRASASLG